MILPQGPARGRAVLLIRSTMELTTSIPARCRRRRSPAQEPRSGPKGQGPSSERGGTRASPGPAGGRRAAPLSRSIRYHPGRGLQLHEKTHLVRMPPRVLPEGGRCSRSAPWWSGPPASRPAAGAADLPPRTPERAKKNAEAGRRTRTLPRARDAGAAHQEPHRGQGKAFFLHAFMRRAAGWSRLHR